MVGDRPVDDQRHVARDADRAESSAGRGPLDRRDAQRGHRRVADRHGAPRRLDLEAPRARSAASSFVVSFAKFSTRSHSPARS